MTKVVQAMFICH